MKRGASIVGKRFGRVIVLKQFARKMSNGAIKLFVRCACDCGQSCVWWRTNLMRGGNPESKSCGCSKRLAKGESGFRRVLKYYRDNARKCRRPFSLLESEFRSLISGECVYCGSPPRTVYRMPPGKSTYTEAGRRWAEFVYNGIDRVDNTEGYTSDNCVSCCETCNSFKSDFTIRDFLDHVEAISRHQNRGAE